MSVTENGISWLRPVKYFSSVGISMVWNGVLYSWTVYLHLSSSQIGSQKAMQDNRTVAGLNNLLCEHN